MLPLLERTAEQSFVISAGSRICQGTDTAGSQSVNRGRNAGRLADNAGWIDLKLVFGTSIGAVVAIQLIAMPTFKVHRRTVLGVPLHSMLLFYG